MLMRPIIVAVLLVAAATLGWFSLHAGTPAQVVDAHALVPPVKILVANQPLQAGTLLKDADVREREVAADAVEPGSLMADEDTRAEIRGAMLRRYLDAGDVVRRPDVLRPRDRGFLAAVLAPGTRAVSIGVDARTGASGLISPGDLVDVILAQEFSHGETQMGRRVVAETVLSTVRVIAVDQQITQGAPTSSAMVPNSPVNRVASTVSLQVTPDQAARLVVAERLGRLTLVLRSMDGDGGANRPASGALTQDNAHNADQSAHTASVFGSDVSAALSQDKSSASPRLRLIQGDAVSDVVFK